MIAGERHSVSHQLRMNTTMNSMSTRMGSHWTSDRIAPGHLTIPPSQGKGITHTLLSRAKKPLYQRARSCSPRGHRRTQCLLSDRACSPPPAPAPTTSRGQTKHP